MTPLELGGPATNFDRGEELLELLACHLDEIGAQPLTLRQREVVDLYFRGATTSEQVAGILGVAASTIRSHRQAICKRVGADSMQDLIRVITAHLSRHGFPATGQASGVSRRE